MTGFNSFLSFLTNSRSKNKTSKQVFMLQHAQLLARTSSGDITAKQPCNICAAACLQDACTFGDIIVVSCAACTLTKNITAACSSGFRLLILYRSWWLWKCLQRAQLPCGKVVALKKLHCLEVENLALDKSFRNEIKFLAEIQHRNIMRLHGFCLHQWSMFFIYKYMDEGSLFCNLLDEMESREMNWTKRVEIIKG
ncbi:hypothetical protein GOBAR_AA11785 [Gossypium barbadense]|uniref:non-specific serine/threonine protein kinase n=1 Tax=Gossypium barbadense TaxID=3634 RepID=A0A2P5XZT6_GOSBA|nr:hypothetical protein GOBAR_AA11785 [Gossypium barbadense]